MIFSCLSLLRDWLKNRATFSTKKINTKTNRDSLAHIFPRLAPATRYCFEFILAHWAVCVCRVRLIKMPGLLSFENRSIIIIVFHNCSNLTCLTDDRSAGLKCSATVVTCSILAASLRLFLAGGWDGCSSWVCWYVSLPSANYKATITSTVDNSETVLVLQ